MDRFSVINQMAPPNVWGPEGVQGPTRKRITETLSGSRSDHDTVSGKPAPRGHVTRVRSPDVSARTHERGAARVVLAGERCLPGRPDGGGRDSRGRVCSLTSHLSLGTQWYGTVRGGVRIAVRRMGDTNQAEARRRARRRNASAVRGRACAPTEPFGSNRLSTCAREAERRSEALCVVASPPG